MIRWLQVIMLSLLAAQAAGADAAHSIIQSVSTPRDQPVAFTELRMSPLFAEPVELQGVVEFSADGTLAKHVAEPFNELISISPQAVVLERNGKRRSVSMRRNSDLWEFYSGLLALLAGDPDGVNKYYEVSVIQPEPEWQVMLRPRSVALAAFVQEMVVKGADGRVLFVRTFQADDNWQEITFEHNSAPAPVMGNQ